MAVFAPYFQSGLRLWQDPSLSAPSAFAREMGSTLPGSNTSTFVQSSPLRPELQNAFSPLPPQKYVAVAAQVVHCGVMTKVPMVARITLVDYRGNLMLDTFVRPTQPVSDYRSAETGIRPINLAAAPSFDDVQRHVRSLVHGKIIVGYALWQFLSVIGISHPAIDTRDAALFLPFRKTLKSKRWELIPLAALIKQLMGRDIGLHGEVPVEIARSVMDLFRSCEHMWEEIIAKGDWPCTLPPESFSNCFT